MTTTETPQSPTGSRTRRRIRRFGIALLIAAVPMVAACTPGEIEQTIGLLTQSFEEAGIEGALSTGSYIAPQVVMVVGSRLGGFGF